MARRIDLPSHLAQARRQGPERHRDRLPIAWVATIPLATVGGGVMSGAYYLALGHLLTNHAIEQSAPKVPRPANA